MNETHVARHDGSVWLTNQYTGYILFLKCRMDFGGLKNLLSYVRVCVCVCVLVGKGVFFQLLSLLLMKERPLKTPTLLVLLY